jgi:hypothetical protein
LRGRLSLEGRLAALRALRRKFIDPEIDEHAGRIVKLLVEFASVVTPSNRVGCSGAGAL